ncbi:hypothetical protein FBUS_01539 [Fasciolopsis buskii]|uniref:Pentatricopeptide repeat-containing protein n=1 Tax=Fasciolopsis buskii TaxID=27845 RepID=A0A8E0RS91_9TREM|nr:hypothetical protein FBUS_01539 [Fasciolopsis buski]
MILKRVLSKQIRQSSWFFGNYAKVMLFECCRLRYVRFSTEKMTHLKKHPVNTSVSKKDPKTKSEFKTDIENGSSESVRFGKLAETTDEGAPVLHKSLEGRSFNSHFWGAIESTVFDPPDELATERRTIRLRPQRPGERLTWNARQIAIQCNKGDVDAALKAFFEGALDTDRIIPPRYLVHRLLDALAQVGRSADAFHVYRRMKEIGMPLTQATYSRLFKSCAEDCSVWQRENKHFFPPSPAALHLPGLQRRRNQLLEKALCPDDVFNHFGGAGLERAQGLWKHLCSRSIPVTSITANALLLALARGGDLTGCFQALDFLLSPSQPTSKKIPAFQPDTYTVTAVLSAVRPASLRRQLAAVKLPTSTPTSPPMTALDLSLTVWHRLLPHLSTVQLGPQCFVSLIQALCCNYDGRLSGSSEHVLLFRPGTGLETTKISRTVPLDDQSTDHVFVNNVLPSDSCVQLKDHTAAETKVGEGRRAGEQITSDSNSVHLVPEFHQAVQVFRPDWSDHDLSFRSPVNLLLPVSDRGILIFPPADGWLLWHRLVLIGGLHGFLESVEQTYRSTVTTQLLTSLISLLPKLKLSTDSSELDVWECELIQQAKQRNINLDMGFFNALIDRRIQMGVSSSLLLSEAVRIGLIPDQITWGLLAKGCTTVDSVKHLLHSFAVASKADSVRAIRPSRTFFASLFAGSGFNWSLKEYLLRLMMKFGTPGGDGDSREIVFDDFQPDRRMITQLEIDVALFRDLLRKGVVPKDGSAVGPSEATQGMVIPPHASAAFRHFVPVYKKWLSIRIAD